MIPQIGQLVTVRNRSYIVNDVNSTKKQPVQTKVSLECIDNDQLGVMLDLIWERENANTRQVFEEDTFPSVMSAKFDNPEQLDALESAIRWSAPSIIEGPKLLSPFMGSIEIEDYQLEPVSRALRLPRVNLLIADDVGLGKTVEAGLVLEELMARGRVKKTLIVTPASLTLQWQSEMADKFQLDFKIIDRDYLLTLRREYGINANPFTSYPRLIISMDYFKRDQVKQLFDQSLKSKKGLKSWDLLIVDEAHNAAPTGKQKYVRDSDRTKLLKHITPHFEHKLFLTATPHNGFTHSFTGLLELLDPLRFNRGPTVNQAQLNTVMIRRLKEQVNTKNFAKRVIDTLSVPVDSLDQKRYSLLDEYIKSRLSNSKTTQIAFALTMLKKRLLSSPLAFARSIGWHKYAIDHKSDAITDEKLLARITQLALEDYSDDEEKEQNEEIAISETTKAMTDLTIREKEILDELVGVSNASKSEPDTKAKRLLSFIQEKLKSGGKWNSERLIIFTEYKDSLEYLQDIISSDERIVTLSGGDSKENREQIKLEFQKHPDESAIRILLATDAASEGLNLQHYCRYLIHYEIPWNPNKMEQRNGRIDRHGQTYSEVYIYHFLHEDNQDSKFLQTLVDKVQTMREDLGSISDILEKGVEEVMLGRKSDLNQNQDRQQIMRKDMGSEVKQKFRYESLIEDLKDSRELLGLDAKSFRNMIHQALIMSGKEGVLSIDDIQWHAIGGLIKQLPSNWHHGLKYLKDKDGYIKKVIFEPGCDIKNNECEILHLSHPITKYAISEFRKELFGFNSRMSRLSYKIIDNIDTLHVKASTRMIITGRLGHLLHEEVVSIAAKVNDDGTLNFIDGKELKDSSYSYSDIASTLSSKLRLQIEKNRSNLLIKVQESVDDRKETLEVKLNKRANEDAKILRSLIDERIREVSQRLKEIRGSEYKQMSLFSFEEEQQYKEDEKWLEHRLEDLKERRSSEPDEIKEQYRIKDVRSFFLSLTLYIPEGAVHG